MQAEHTKQKKKQGISIKYYFYQNHILPKHVVQYGTSYPKNQLIGNIFQSVSFNCFSQSFLENQ